MNNLNKFGLPSGLGGNQNSFSRPTGVYQVPTDFVELPSQGKFYSKNSPLYGAEKLEIKYMTAREEDLLVSPALQKEGIAIDRVIESLLVNKDIRAKELLVGDKTAILLNARKNAYGEEYQFFYVCKNCGKECESVKNLSEIGIKNILEDESCKFTENGTLLITLPKTNSIVELKMLTGEDESLIEKMVEKRLKNNLPSEALLIRYRQMIVSVNGVNDIETIVSFINSLPIADSVFLRKKYSEFSPDVEFKFSEECKHCSVENEGDVPISANFFWPNV